MVRTNCVITIFFIVNFSTRRFTHDKVMVHKAVNAYTSALNIYELRLIWARIFFFSATEFCNLHFLSGRNVSHRLERYICWGNHASWKYSTGGLFLSNNDVGEGHILTFWFEVKEKRRNRRARNLFFLLFALVFFFFVF